MLFILVLGLIALSDVSDAKCICCKEINDYCCQTPKREDACCVTSGDIKEKGDWSKLQCEKGNSTETKCSKPGQSVPSPFDSCNTCLCTDEGIIKGCTKILCPKDHCGKPAKTKNHPLDPRILGGREVDPVHSQPWVVRLGRCCQCTGTLISNRHILTAAHCELFVKPLVATLGDHDSNKKEIGEVTIKIKTQTKHPLYWLEGDTAGYDFAVWTLEEPVQFSETIQPVCLPTSADESYTGSQVLNSGWGKSVWKEGMDEPTYDTRNLVLRTVNLTVFSMKECKNTKWLSDRLNKITTPGRDVDDTMMICAGVTPSDVTNQWIGPNKGDSGGPLLIKDSETEAFTLIGVTCDAPYTWEQFRTGPYATYSKVSAVLPWIHETMQTN